MVLLNTLRCRQTPHVNTTTLGGLLGLWALLCQPAHAVTEAEMVQQLRLPAAATVSADSDAGTAKALNDFRLPDRTGICRGNERDGVSASKLVVVAMPPASAPHLSLGLQFEYASYRLTPADKLQLDALAQALIHPELRQGRYTVAGHTDASGDALSNERLSCARALNVREHLIDRGVPADRVSAYGYGSARPVVPGNRDSTQNRRVEIRRAE